MTWALTEVKLAHRIIILMGAVICCIVGLNLVTPASRWFSVGALEVHSARSADEVAVEYRRQIVRQFEGAWRVEIDQRQGDAWAEFCATPDNPNTYRPDTVLPSQGRPDTVSLAWFVGDDPGCLDLPPGLYRLCAAWQVNTDSRLGLWSRLVLRCDEFEVTG